MEDKIAILILVEDKIGGWWHLGVLGIMGGTFFKKSEQNIGPAKRSILR